jgi:uncharacterized protein (DUF3084 family)
MASWVFVLAGIALLRPEQTGLAYLLAALSGSGIAAAYMPLLLFSKNWEQEWLSGLWDRPWH